MMLDQERRLRVANQGRQLGLFPREKRLQRELPEQTRQEVIEVLAMLLSEIIGREIIKKEKDRDEQDN
jgi:hypothetical protein